MCTYIVSDSVIFDASFLKQNQFDMIPYVRQSRYAFLQKNGYALSTVYYKNTSEPKTRRETYNFLRLYVIFKSSLYEILICFHE